MWYAGVGMSNTILPILERIGPYRILGKLGAGGMGTVYKGLQESLQRSVAMKVVNPDSAADPRFQERFLREARAMAQLQSPFVIACYDAGLADGQLFMALELANGGDLLDLMERKGGRLNEALALALVRDCCEGLEAIEAAHLIHRDLKPANIFITDLGTAKLADLGLARTTTTDAERTTMAGMIMGTPAYIAPEQARGETDLDIRADLFSLGATLFHLVTGSTPYPGSDPIATLIRVLNDPLPDPRTLCPDLSQATTQLIHRLMAKERTQRPPSARSARQLIEAAQRGSTRIEPAATPVQPVQRPLSPEATPRPTPSNRATERTPLATPALPVESPLTRSATARIDPAQLLQLAKRIIVDQGGLRASLALAPGASFPRLLLDQLLEVSSITHGLIEDNLAAAAKTADLPRRITLAKGDPPTPDAAGRDVRGGVIPAVPDSVVIRISDDAMQAWALYRSSTPPTMGEVRLALAQANVTHGYDTAAIQRFGQKPPSGGKLTVAKGNPTVPTQDAGFAIAVGPEGELGLCPVEPGMIVGTWRESTMGTPGMDVCGRPIPIEEPREPEPESLAGAGVEMGRNREGDLCLRSTRQGVVQRQQDGLVRVVGVVEIPGDLAADTPVVTDDVVVVRGNVLPGANVSSTSDIIILGDLSDAAVNAGGDIDVRGEITGGRELRAAGTVTAAAATNRRILAGNVRISGILRGCDLASTGSIEVGSVVGGSLAAGGDIRCQTIGDANGTPTTVWAGHHLCLDRESELVRLEEARHESKQKTLLSEGSALMSQQEDLSKRTDRLSKAQYVKGDALSLLRDQQESLALQQEQVRKQLETERRELMRARTRRQELEHQTRAARIQVAGVAYDGATIRIGDGETHLLTEPRLRPVF